MFVGGEAERWSQDDDLLKIFSLETSHGRKRIPLSDPFSTPHSPLPYNFNITILPNLSGPMTPILFSIIFFITNMED